MFIYINGSFGVYDSDTGDVAKVEGIRSPIQCFSLGNKIIAYHGFFDEKSLSVIDSSGENSTLLSDGLDRFATFEIYQDRLYFRSNDENTGEELWVTDGTLEGTYLIEDFQPGEADFNPNHFEILNRKLCFAGDGPLYGNEVYFLDRFFVPNVTGTAYHDKNENGTLDSGEQLIQGIQIELSENGKTAYTNATGRYGFEVVNANSFSLRSFDKGCWEAIDTLKEINLPSGTNGNLNINFPFRKVPISEKEKELEIVSSAPRCNSKGVLWLSFTSESGCDPHDGKIELEIDPLLEFRGSSVPFDSLNGRYTFYYDSLDNQSGFKIKISVRFPDEDFTGELLTHHADIFILNGNDYLLSNSISISNVLRCGVDPNDKNVSPIREEGSESNYTQFDEELFYKIRFQNTGNDTAFNVLIKDQLSPMLDWATLKVLGASHSYLMDLSRDGNISFYFEGIALPDSTTNELDSHGYVSFSVKAKANIEELDIVTNQAEIFFDQNRPIITNEVYNTFVEYLDFDEDGYLFYEDCDDLNDNAFPGAEEIPNNDVDEDCDGFDLKISNSSFLDKSSYKVYPNPTSGLLYVISQDEEAFAVNLYGIDGRLKLSEENTKQLDLSLLPPGPYVLEVERLASNQKFVELIIKAL